MNILLICREDHNQHVLLPQIAEGLQRLGLRSRLVHDVEPRVKHRLWTLSVPTIVLCFSVIRRFMPHWATIWQQASCDKIHECAVLERAGVPVPMWRLLSKEVPPDLSAFGAYVVVKPVRGGYGALVRIVRRDKVRWRSWTIDRVGAVDEAMMVQAYVHTGPWPTSYRVGTVFGEPIYALRITADRARKPIDFTGEDGSRAFAGCTIVASSKGCTMDAEVPDDVIALARQAHAAFPTVPLLGVDVVRDQATGKLYVLEVNASGDTFHLTSENGQRVAREFGIDLCAQFGGAAAVARGIHRRVREAQMWRSKPPHAPVSVQPASARRVSLRMSSPWN